MQKEVIEMRIIIKVTSQILTNVLAMNNQFKGCWNFERFVIWSFETVAGHIMFLGFVLCSDYLTLDLSGS